jgi:hypothetical protein
MIPIMTLPHFSGKMLRGISKDLQMMRLRMVEAIEIRAIM